MRLCSSLIQTCSGYTTIPIPYRAQIQIRGRSNNNSSGQTRCHVYSTRFRANDNMDALDALDAIDDSALDALEARFALAGGPAARWPAFRAARAAAGWDTATPLLDDAGCRVRWHKV